MRYRELSPASPGLAGGDYTFGQGRWLVNSPAAVGQAVLTRLRLFSGEWFLDVTRGLVKEDVLGSHTDQTRDLAVQSMITETEGVTEIVEYASYVNPATRAFTVGATIDTVYGRTTLSTTL